MCQVMGNPSKEIEVCIGDNIKSEKYMNTIAIMLAVQIYTGGSPCDVKEVERTAEVRYMCSEKGGTALLSVREVHSCSYQIHIATPLICQHPSFQGIKVKRAHQSNTYPRTDPRASMPKGYCWPLFLPSSCRISRLNFLV